MKRKLLTLEDLYNYFSSKSDSSHFSYDDETSIVVQEEGRLIFEEAEESPAEGLLPVEFKACHTGVNLNKTSISEDAMNAALASFSNRPVLGYIHEVDGEPEFFTHNRHIDDEEIVYDEVPVGVIPESCDARLVIDEENGKQYVVVKGYIYEEYTKAAEILRREKECPVSVELSVRELSYSAEEKVLVIESFYFMGITILGKDEEGNDVNPGMEGATVTLLDFDAENNSLLTSVNADVRIEEKIRKEENSMEDNKEVLKNLDEVAEEEVTETEFEEEVAEEEEAADEPEEAEESEEETPADDFSVQYSVTYGDVHKDFSVSLNDVIYALTDLVNATYGDADDTYYTVEVFADDKYVLMVDAWNGKAYKQTYSVRQGNYSLVGDRVPMYNVWVTEDEKKALENMKATYDAIQEKLAKFEAEPQKMDILESQAYAKIAETDEFKALEANHFDLSVEEVAAKADEILLSYAKNGKIDFSLEDGENKAVSGKNFPIPNKKAKNYGSLFSGIINK